MSEPEFVALSEERIWAIVDEYDQAITNDDPERLRFGLSAMAMQVAAEASENTKRWLMELVCLDCGETMLPTGKTQRWFVHRVGRCSKGGDDENIRRNLILRAEYLSRTEPL